MKRYWIAVIAAVALTFALPEMGRHLLAAPAVAQGDGDRALGVVLADDVAVEFGNDFAGGKGGHDFISGVVPGL